MKSILNVYEIRKGVFALGRKGKRAQAVCTYNAKIKGYMGIRGVKPTISEDAKRAAGVSKALRERLNELAAN